jgi:hypothetical protein
MIGGEWKRAGGDRQSPLLVRFDEVERLANSDDVDILLTHDAPVGVRFERIDGARSDRTASSTTSRCMTSTTSAILTDMVGQSTDLAYG